MTDRLDWFHVLSEIPEDGLSRQRSADADVRAAIAADLDIIACQKLDLTYDIKPLIQGRFLLMGRLLADVTQSCVVTLEPVDSRIDEAFEVEFRPGIRPDAEFDALDERDIEPLEGDVIPVGRIAYEQLASALDPYPRKAGAEFEPPQMRAEDVEASNPFSVLKSLKPKA
jgi:uncharacterized metal-binding protein YceD (DUF177 family)